ncbi:MAG: DUF4469 domain-containing protein [Prevotellaceae bacterium]|jgi:hypothetical protein|nr:DUF4469 domain-containing protein [Prevotellaceae bacterium]
MANNEKTSVIVELYDLTITDRKDDRFGRVVTSKSLNEDDLIKIAVSRRTDLSPTTLRASLDILKEIAVEQIAGGSSVYFGLGYFSLTVNGVFVGDHAKWDPAQHSLHVKAAASAELREAIKATQVNVRGMSQSGIVINSIHDVASGEDNARLTPGGGVNMSGSKIRIAGDNPDNGIYLTNQSTQAVTAIATNAILVNDPSKVSFIVPADLPAGDYKLSITTQYSPGTKLLVEPRTYVFDYILTV